MTQEYINITNLERIINLKLQIGSPIAFRIVSGVNADIDAYTTGLLQTEYQDNYSFYQEEVNAITGYNA